MMVFHVIDNEHKIKLMLLREKHTMQRIKKKGQEESQKELGLVETENKNK